VRFPWRNYEQNLVFLTRLAQAWPLFFLFFFFNACILRYYLSKPLTSLSCSLNTVFPGLNMWDTFAFDCCDFKVRPGTVLTLKSDPGHRRQTWVCTDSPTSEVSTDYNPGLHRQSNLEVSTDYLLLQLFFIQYISIATCSRMQGYRKEPLFYTKRSSGRDRVSNPGHLLGRQRR
jgi:hypothetical protein